jgi:hypothetical protein
MNTMPMSNSTAETDRVRRNTSAEQLQEIDGQIEHNIRFYSTMPAEAISRRLRELDLEWSMERWLETNASALAFLGTVLGLAANRKWLVVPLAVTGFLFQHAVQGWCPPVPALRKLGVRTRAEIDREKYALKLLRGDFREAASLAAEKDGRVEKVLAALNA